MTEADANVLRKAKILSMLWTGRGKRLDHDEWLTGMNDLHEAICAAYGVDPKVGFKMETA